MARRRGERRLVKNAEAYYRVMYQGAAESWNLRDTHMFETLEPAPRRQGAALEGDRLGAQQPHRQRGATPTWASGAAS